MITSQEIARYALAMLDSQTKIARFEAGMIQGKRSQKVTIKSEIV
jgi:hypothetical protein